MLQITPYKTAVPLYPLSPLHPQVQLVAPQAEQSTLSLFQQEFFPARMPGLEILWGGVLAPAGPAMSLVLHVEPVEKGSQLYELFSQDHRSLTKSINFAVLQ